jgi:DNA polymerase-3 subunit delta
LKNGSEPSAAYLFIGSDRYLKEKAINDLRSSFLDSSSGDLDHVTLHGSDTSADRILDCVSTMPFFSSKRLVVVRDAEKLSKEDTQKLIKYIRHSNKHACLVIDTANGDILKDDPGLARHATVVRFDELSDNDVSSWISRYLAGLSKTIDEEAVEMLKEFKGRDLLSLSQELEKLASYTASRRNITASDVEALVGKSAVSSAFDIAHAAAELDAAKAIATVHEMLSFGKKPHEIIGLLAWHFRALLKIKECVDAGGSEYEAASSAKVPRRKIKDFFAQSSLYSRAELESKLRSLLDADLGIKRARYSPSLVLEFAVLKLCLPGGG